MSSIKDVAKYAHVSVATVSRALNGNGYVSEEAEQKIREAVKALNYTPNELARNFFRNQSHIIGVVIPDMEYPFFSKLCKCIEMQLYDCGYKTMICNTIGISNREKDYLDMLDRNMVDGLIVGSHSLDESAYLKVNKPIVALDRNFGEAIPLIHSDHRKGGYLAADLMIRSGCRNVIQFSTYQMVNTPARDRHVEFERVCKEHGIQVTTVETAWNEFNYEYYEQVASKYLTPGNHYDGIFTVDLSAACCMQTLKKQQKKIPDDVCIVGYDGVEIGRFTDPVLTTISQNVPEIALSCVRAITGIINGRNDVPNDQVIDVEVLHGNTVRC